MSLANDIRHGRHCVFRMHVHLVFVPKNSLKGVSSRLLRLERPDIAKKYWKDVLWSPSYFAARCGGAPISILKEYIEQQKAANV
jgi:putative transposase